MLAIPCLVIELFKRLSANKLSRLILLFSIASILSLLDIGYLIKSSKFTYSIYIHEKFLMINLYIWTLDLIINFLINKELF